MNNRAWLIVLVAASTIAFAETAGSDISPPAKTVTEAELLGSLQARTGIPTSLAKDILSARIGDDRVSVDVLKRTSPEEGPVVHQSVTELYRIIDGGGGLETGGSLVAPKPMLDKEGKPLNPANIGPSLIGTSIAGGNTRAVRAGDVILIPPGTPHRFTNLDGSVTYMVVRFNPRWYSVAR